VADSDSGEPSTRHWVDWHNQYDEPSSGLSWRLRTIQAHIRRFVDLADPGEIRAISLCAGQGRDLIGALAGHPRACDVSARLVELDPVNVQLARELAAEAGLSTVSVVRGDASDTSAYDGAVPADLILVCGVFGNIPESDIERTVTFLPHLAAPRATVVWTRHRMAPDLTPRIRQWFFDAGFIEVAFSPFPDGVQAVGVNRLHQSPRPFRPGERLFEFVGDGNG
jgi:hypothetical protein